MTNANQQSQLGTNLDAVLEYVAAGIPVFPCNSAKAPLTTNGFKDAATDQRQIRQWWQRWPKAMIGMPTGRASGIDVIDIDVKPDEGINGLEFLPKWPTMSPIIVETPSGGRHLYFRASEKVRCTTDVIAPGIDTRGEGGYVIVPPSASATGAYKFLTGEEAYLEDPTKLPAFPPELLRKLGVRYTGWGGDTPEADAERVAAAMAVIPNPDLGWEEWKKFGMAIWRATGGAAEGFTIFDEWSSKSAKYDADTTRKEWDQLTRSPPTRIGAGTLFHHASIADPHWDGGKGARRIHSWDSPDISLLDDRRGALPEFPLQELGDELRPIVQRIALGAGVSADHVALPLLSIAGSLIGAGRRVQAVPSWTEPMTLWGAVVDYSGGGKTPGIAAIKKPLDSVEDELKPEIEAKRREHELRVETARATKKAWKADLEKHPDTPPPTDADDPGRFIAPRLYTIDVTIERMAELLQARPRGALLIYDELAGWFNNMSRYSKGDDKQFWLMAWDGGAYSVERKTAPAPIAVPNLLIGLVGGLQPDKLAECFKGAADGTYARFLFAWPPRTPYRPLGAHVKEIDADIVKILRRLALLEERIPLSQPAAAAFEGFRELIHGDTEALEGRARDWWAKAPAHILRLAGTLTYIEWAIDGGQEPKQILSEYIMSAAALVMDYFWPHARACLRQIGLAQHNADARRVLRWTKANRKQQVSREEARREALTRQQDADGTEAILNYLERAGWLKRQVTATGGRPATRWDVNPRLLEEEEV